MIPISSLTFLLLGKGIYFATYIRKLEPAVPDRYINGMKVASSKVLTSWKRKIRHYRIALWKGHLKGRAFHEGFI